MGNSTPYIIDLSIIIPCYFDQENCSGITDLLRHYTSYDPQILDRIQFILVDDCSPCQVQIPPDIDLNILILRVRENITWNQGGARNLGVVYARSDKVLATDLDHLYTEKTLNYILSFGRLGKTMYRFRRKGFDGQLMKPHPNSFLMSRGRFLEFFGVDEEFCGNYGSEDGIFWRWQRYNGTRFKYLPTKYANNLRDYDRKRSDHSLIRDKQRNRALKKQKKHECDVWGYRGGHSRQFLSFTWDIKEDRKRQNITWCPPKDKIWKKLWPLRVLLS